MKTRLTPEESQHLIDLGVPKEKASKVAWARITDIKGDKIPENEQMKGVSDKPFSVWHVGFESFSTDDIFTLTDLLEILPKEIEVNGEIADLCFDWNSETKRWCAAYAWLSEEFCAQKKELIDTLYQLACWYYGEYLKSEKK